MGGVHERARRVGVEGVLLGGEPVELVRLHGDRELAGALELGIHPVPFDGPLDAVEVLQPQLLELVELLRPAVRAVLLAVREARLAEAAVASGRRPADRARLEDHDAPVGVALLRAQGRPEARVAAADDHEVGGDLAGERRMVGAGEAVEPEHGLARGGQAVPDDRGGSGPAFEDRGSHGYHVLSGCRWPSRR